MQACVSGARSHNAALQAREGRVDEAEPGEDNKVLEGWREFFILSYTLVVIG